MAQAPAPVYQITTVAGAVPSTDGRLAPAAPLGSVESIALDSRGNLFLADSLDHRVRRVASDGRITTVAGTGVPGFTGDGGAATLAALNGPYGVAADSSGNVFVGDLGNHRVRRVGPDGAIRTLAVLQSPRNLAVTSAGDLYVSDAAAHRIYRVTAAGQVAAVAGTGTAGNGEEGDALGSALNFPTGLAVGSDGAVYIADSGNRVVRRLEGGRVTTVVRGLSAPLGLALDREGNLYVADGAANRIVRRAAGTGALTNIDVGVPVNDLAVDGSGRLLYASGRRIYLQQGSVPPLLIAGDGTYDSGIGSRLAGPIGVALDGSGGLLVAEEQGGRVRRVTASGQLEAVAGGDASDPVAVAYDPIHGLRIAEHTANRIRGVTVQGTAYVAAGDGEPGFRGDGNPAAGARLNHPRGIAFDRQGGLWIADSQNHRVRRIGPNGIITTVAGDGTAGYSGDGAAAVRAQLNAPQGVWPDGAGGAIIADTGNHAIRRVDADGVITTLPAAGLNAPAAVVSGGGAVFVADTYNHRIVRIAADGSMAVIAGTGAAGLAGDGGPALQAQLAAPTSLVLDPASGTIFVADLDNQRIRKLTPSGEAAVIPPPAQTEPTAPAAELSIVSAASLRTGPVAPGQMVSIFGAGVGPERTATGRLGAFGALETTLEETQARFDGVAAPLFYVSAGQINAQVPYAMAGRSVVAVEVVRSDRVTGATRVAVAPAAPALFTVQGGSGPVAAWNEDGTANAEANPAARGSVVTLLATGEGLTDPLQRDGVPAAVPLAKPRLPVTVWVGSSEADVVWAGAAPGLVGLMQLNVRLPGFFTPPGVRPLTLRVGVAESQPGVTIAVK